MWAIVSTIQAARKDTSRSFSIALLQFITDFTTAINEKSRPTVPDTLLARLLSFSASFLAIEPPSCCVKYRTNGGVSTKGTFPTFWTSASRWSSWHPSSRATDAASSNAKCCWQSTLKCLRRVCRGGGCDGECSSCVVVTIHTKGLYERKKVGVAYFAQRNLFVIYLIDPEEQIPVKKMSSIKSCHSYSRACTLRGTFTGRCCHLSDSFLHNDRREHFLVVSMSRTLQNHRLGATCVVLRQKHVVKCWRDFTFLATLKRIEIGIYCKVVILFDESNYDEVRCRRTSKRIAVGCPAESAFIGNDGTR